jgi:hypothetical protein
MIFLGLSLHHGLGWRVSLKDLKMERPTDDPKAPVRIFLDAFC